MVRETSAKKLPKLGWKKKKKEARTRDDGTDLSIPLSFVSPSVF